jgi:co-chaperonin GroES (HSP10)
MSTFTIKHARPLFRRQLREAPAHPLGDRVLVWAFPPEKVTEGGIHIAEKAKKKYMAGILIAAGDQAADKLRDIGVELGDEVWYAQYAGLIEAWHHIVGEDKADCPHDTVWEHVPATDPRWEPHGGPNDGRELRACRACGTLKLSEEVIVMDVADVCLDVSLQERFERREIIRYRDYDDDGRTRYMLDRRIPRPDSFETVDPLEMKGAK